MWTTNITVKSNSGRPCFVLLPFIGYLVLLCHSLENASSGLLSSPEKTRECGRTSCDDLCRRLAENSDPTLACKTFERALPHPKIGRTCILKFREGYQFACTAGLCSCKGLSAAVTGVLEQGEQSSVRSNAKDGRRYASDPAAELDQSGTRQSVINDLEAIVSPQGEGKTRGEERSTSWVAALGTPVEYVDYALVAKERVRSEHRRRGSELKRGPPCPVCNG